MAYVLRRSVSSGARLVGRPFFLQSTSSPTVPKRWFTAYRPGGGGSSGMRRQAEDFERRPRQRKTSFPYIKVVPQQEAWVVERFGKFHSVLQPGLNLLVPVADKIQYIHSLKEEAITIPNQSAITKDNVTIDIDGVLYMKIVNPERASYGIDDVYFAIKQLAMTTMRSELGKISLDQTFANRDIINEKIVAAINAASIKPWGTECLRYEIRDINPPENMKAAMGMEAEAERKKRAIILTSMGDRDAAINKADGEAAAIRIRGEAVANALAAVSSRLTENGGPQAASLRVAEKYVEAFGNIAQKGTTMLLPSNASDPGSMVAQAMAVYQTVSSRTAPSASSSSTSVPTAGLPTSSRELASLDSALPEEILGSGPSSLDSVVK